MLKNLHVNVRFLDGLSQMPLRAKFLKEILSKKRKIDKHRDDNKTRIHLLPGKSAPFKHEWVAKVDFKWVWGGYGKNG